MQFETQTSGTWGSEVNVVGNTIESTSTNVTAGTEAFDLVFKDMNAGAAASKTFRILSGGGIQIPNGVIATPTWTMTLPIDARTSGQVLSTDGTGITSWVANQLPKININPTYNVATTGDDTTGDGSVGAPFATIVHALEVAAGFDYQSLYFPTIKIANGTYLEQVSVPLFTNLGGQGLGGSQWYDGRISMESLVLRLI
jgi:hypothetical protein